MLAMSPIETKAPISRSPGFTTLASTIDSAQWAAAERERLNFWIKSCGTMEELEAATADIEAAHSAGTITTETVEELAAAATLRGRAIHANLRLVTFRVAVEELTAGDLRCPCCGNGEWWERGGRATCSICHPVCAMPASRAAA